MFIRRRDLLKASGVAIATPLALFPQNQESVSLKNRATGFEWRHPGLRIEPVFVTEAGPMPPKVAARQQVQVFPDSSVVQFRCEFRNEGSENVPGVTAFGPLRMALKPGLGPLQVHCMRRNSYAIERIPVDRRLELLGGQWNSPQHAGLLILEAMDEREFLFTGIEWERGWRYRISRTDQATWLEVDVADLRHDLAPGQTLLTPRVFLGTAGGDLDAAVSVAHRYLKAHVYPKPLDNSPWVVYDIWGTEAEGVEKALLDEIDFAADLGVEMFYVDASWYKGSSKKGTGDWGCGLGNYAEDREKFPRGLAYMSERAHGRGLRFGLWVGPNIVDSRLIPGTIPRRWVVQVDGADRVLRIPSWESACHQVCLGCREYIEHLKSNLSRIVEAFRLDWLKWDNSGIPGMPGRCNRADHGHQAGDGSYAALAGQYEIFEHLHGKFPNLVLEQCGYGSRHDLGLARTIRANWLSDASYPAAHVRENALVARFAYPSFYNGGWVLKGDPDLEKAKNDAALDTIFRSRMIGLFGFGTLLGTLPERVSLFRPEVLAAARRNIALYKKYRHLLHGDCYGLFPPAGSPEGWQAVQFVAGDRAVILSFRGKSTQSTMRIPVRGVTAARDYVLTMANTNTQVRVPGSQLLREGIVLDLSRPEMSEVLLINGA
jgi:alpha-galactosidase